MALITRPDGTTVSVAEDAMQPTTNLNEAAAFFFKHAGYSYDPKTETPEQGRTRVAQTLELAERFARSYGLVFAWEVDPDIDSSDFDDSDEPWQLWQCCAYDQDENLRASLGGIDLGRDGHPDSDTYARVIEAELADEVLGQQREEERAYGPDDTPDDTPSLANCDDAGTGEGRFHGRM